MIRQINYYNTNLLVISSRTSPVLRLLLILLHVNGTYNLIPVPKAKVEIKPYY